MSKHHPSGPVVDLHRTGRCIIFVSAEIPAGTTSAAEAWLIAMLAPNVKGKLVGMFDADHSIRKTWLHVPEVSSLELLGQSAEEK